MVVAVTIVAAVCHMTKHNHARAVKCLVARVNGSRFRNASKPAMYMIAARSDARRAEVLVHVEIHVQPRRLLLLL